MSKIKAEPQGQNDHQFPFQILYSSPPEASTLNAWVQEVESKRARGNSDKTSDDPNK